MTLANENKKRMVCKRCTAVDPNLVLRVCDEPVCGRIHCPHMGKRTGELDCCGACNLAKSRAAKKAGAK